MSKEVFGLIFILFWLTGVAIAWYFAMFKGYDKVWGEKMLRFQSKFAFFELYRRFINFWYKPFIIRTVLTIFLLVGFYALYIAISDVIQD